MLFILLFLLHVPTEPHSGEVSPSQFSHNMVAIVEQITNLHWVITTFTEKNKLV